MQKGERKYVVILVLAVALAVTVEWIQPTPLDWTPSFEQDDQRPYGSFVPFEVLPALLPDAEVEAVDVPPYLLLRDTTNTGIAYVFITGTFAPDPVEADALLDFAARGNTVFVAASHFGDALADTLRLEVVLAPPALPLSYPDSLQETDGINFVNPALRAEEDFLFRPGTAAAAFERFDTLRATVLGTDSRGRANYIRMEYGAGALYLNTVPLAFTNYAMLDDPNDGYVYRALSYLAPREVWWDAYYKPNRVEAATPLRYVLRQPSLRAAYGVLVALVLLFVAFEARRRQRVVPIIEPLRNTTVEFVRTVGHLYFQHGDHANLAAKKSTHFLDYVRTHLRLPTGTVDGDFLARVAERSGVPPEDVRAVFAAIDALQRRSRISEDELHRLNACIEMFYRKSKR